MLNEEERSRFYAVIMAGGGGTRLWPWSRREQPKQMLKISGGRSMFQITVDRLRPLIEPDAALVVTTEEQADKLRAQVLSVPAENYLREPLPRGTAAVVGLGAIHALARNPEAVMAVVTADHFIQDETLFRELLSAAYRCAEDGHLVTLGIEPTFPSTGMGYIEQAERLGEYEGLAYHKVSRFTEKPDRATAEQFLATGRFSWNSGMFIWRADRILAEMEHDLPELYAKLLVIQSAIGTPDYDRVLNEIWPTILKTTIDYGVMEKADDVVVLPAKGLGWNDVGSWESLLDILPADEAGNIRINCRTIHINSENVLTCSEHSDKLFVTIGVKDMVIVETDRAVLVLPRSESQRIKEIIERLEDADK